MQPARGGWRPDRTTVVAGALFLVACAVAYGGLFSHAYPGDVGTYAQYGRALVLHGRIPYRDFYDEYPPGLGAGLRAARPDLERALRARVQAADDGAAGSASLVCAGLDRAPARPHPAAAGADRPRAGADGARVPQPLRPAARAARLARARRAPARRRSDLSGALLGAGTAIKLYPAVVVPRRRPARALASPGAGTAYLVAGAVLVLPVLRCSRPAGSATASGRRRSATSRSRASAPRSCSRGRSSASTTRGGSAASRARSTSAARPPTSRRRAQLGARDRARARRRLGVLARPRRRRPHGDRVGGGGDAPSSSSGRCSRRST